MYNDGYDNYEDQDVEEQSSNSKIKEIYNNNKVLLWILGIIVLLLIIIPIFTGGSKNSSKNVIEPENKKEMVQLLRSKDIKVKIRGNVYNGDRSKIDWKSANTNIVEVDKSGRVTGKMIGSTTINIIYTESGTPYSTSVEVIVFKGNESVTLQNANFDDKSLVININGRFTLSDKLSVTPNSAYVYDMSYESSNPSVASVDSNGVVTGQREGKATITVYVNEKAYTTKIDVYVTNTKDSEMVKLPQKIEFKQGELLKIPVNDSVNEINLDLSPSDASSKFITWKSSDESVIVVNDEGKVAAKKSGTATITATALNGVSGKIIVEGSNDLVGINSISVVPSNINISANGTYTITPIISPDNASNKALVFETSNPSVATVSTNSTKTSGIIYGNRAGTAVITIKSESDSSKMTTLNVTVTGSSSPVPSNTSGTGSIAVRLGDSASIVPNKSCSGVIDYYKAPLQVTIKNYSGNANYVSYCYSKGCTPNDNKREKLPVTFEIKETGTFILKVRKYTSEFGNNEIASSGSSNYLNGSLVYYINTKASGLSCTSNTTWESGSATVNTSKNITVSKNMISNLNVNGKEEVTVTLNNISSATINVKEGQNIISVDKSLITSTSKINITGKAPGTALVEINGGGITKTITVSVKSGNNNQGSATSSGINITFPTGTIVPVNNGTTYGWTRISSNERADIYFCVNQSNSRSQSPTGASKGTWVGKSYYYQPSGTCNKYSNSSYVELYVPSNSRVCVSIGKDGNFSSDKCVTAPSIFSTSNSGKSENSTTSSSTTKTPTLSSSGINITFPTGTLIPVNNGTTYGWTRISSNERADIYFCVNQSNSRSQSPTGASKGTWAGKSYYYHPSGTCNKYSNSTFVETYFPINSRVCVSIEKNGEISSDKCVSVPAI